MSWPGQQDKVPSSHSEEQSGTIFSLTQTAGVWDGVTEQPRFKTPNTRRIRKFSPNHILIPTKPTGAQPHWGTCLVPLLQVPRSGLTAPKCKNCYDQPAHSHLLQPPLPYPRHPTFSLGSLP